MNEFEFEEHRSNIVAPGRQHDRWMAVKILMGDIDQRLRKLEDRLLAPVSKKESETVTKQTEYRCNLCRTRILDELTDGAPDGVGVLQHLRSVHDHKAVPDGARMPFHRSEFAAATDHFCAACLADLAVAYEEVYCEPQKAVEPDEESIVNAGLKRRLGLMRSKVAVNRATETSGSCLYAALDLVLCILDHVEGSATKEQQYHIAANLDMTVDQVQRLLTEEGPLSNDP